MLGCTREAYGGAGGVGSLGGRTEGQPNFPFNLRAFVHGLFQVIAMNVFYEFHKITRALQSLGCEYAVVGGVAMAFHSKLDQADMEALSDE